MKFDGEMDRILTWLKELSLCLGQLSLIPVPSESDAERPLSRILWAYPVIGAFLGACVGAVYAVALGLGLTPFLAAILALVCLLGVTGAMHDSNLAEVIDRFAGLSGRTNLETSGGLGIAGILAIMLSLGARVGALAVIADAAAVTASLVAALALSLAVVVVVSYSAPEDLGDEYSEPSARIGSGVVLSSAVIAILLAALVLPFGAGAAIVGACLCGAAIAYTAWRSLDLERDQVIAAAQPITEIVVLLILAASAT